MSGTKKMRITHLSRREPGSPKNIRTQSLEGMGAYPVVGQRFTLLSSDPLDKNADIRYFSTSLVKRIKTSQTEPAEDKQVQEALIIETENSVYRIDIY